MTKLVEERKEMMLEERWETFFQQYIANVKKYLPESYRAKQWEHGSVEKALVLKYEGLFLREPLKEAMNHTYEMGRQSMIKDVFEVIDTWEEGHEDVFMEKLEALKKGGDKP